MAKRKQRRRREKLQRHEYEYVIETEEGEVPVERLRERDGRRRGDDGRRGQTEGEIVDRRGRPLQKPSLARVLRRALIFGPILLVFVYLTSGDRLSPAAIVVNALILIAFFIPFSYLVDTVVYRIIVRRHERTRATKPRR